MSKKKFYVLQSDADTLPAEMKPRQLWNMKKFYERYAGHDEKVFMQSALGF